MGAISQVRGALAATLVLLIGSGCGRAAHTTARGDGSIAVDAIAAGSGAFDVTAALHATGGVTGSGLPESSSFTLVLDAGVGRVIAGGNGQAAVVNVTSTDGRTFRSSGSFSVGDPSPNACGGLDGVRFESFEITVAGGVLTGTAAGVATISCGDCSFTVQFAATLSGTTDNTPPRLLGAGAVPATPFDSFALATSEPLPATATARLVGADGTAIDLVPSVVDGDVPLVVGFSKPDVVLPAGQAYFVTLDGLVDFAGHPAEADPPLGITSFPAAPEVPEDGFESATGATLGGAMVMTGGPLPAISDSTSLYIGNMGAPGLDVPRWLMVKLVRQSGDTVLRFSYRMVAPDSPPLFNGFVRVGSERASGGLADYSFMANAPTDTLMVAGQTAYASGVTTMTVPLPDDAIYEVLVVISPITTSCGPLRVQNEGLLIDDLRLE